MAATLHITPYMTLQFVDRGRTHEGVDCYGLAYLINREQLGRDVPSYTEAYVTCHDSQEIASIIQREQVKTWEPITPDAVQPGDLVVLRILGHPWHCGVMLSATKFLHIERGANVSQDCVESLRWKRRVEGFYRWKS